MRRKTSMHTQWDDYRVPILMCSTYNSINIYYNGAGENVEDTFISFLRRHCGWSLSVEVLFPVVPIKVGRVLRAMWFFELFRHNSLAGLEDVSTKGKVLNNTGIDKILALRVDSYKFYQFIRYR